MAINFKDPNPPLSGPPTQRLSGLRFKSPSVDNPNIKLPSSVTDTSIKLPEKPELPSGFNPNKFDPATTAGNTSFTDPLTGKIGNTSDLPEPPKIDTSGVNPDEQLKSSSEKLNEIKGSVPKPKVEIPTGPRIKKVEMRTPGVKVPSTEQIQKVSLDTYK